MGSTPLRLPGMLSKEETEMKKLILAVLVTIGCTAAGFAVEVSDCGSASGISALYHEALFGSDRQTANAELLQSLFPAVKCLSRMGYFAEPSGLKGRYAVTLETLSILKRKTLRLSSAEAIEAQARLLKMNQGTDR